VSSRIAICGGCVLTLGSKSPNFTEADVLIDDGVVVEVGRALRSREAETVDATGTIVMPGFVDTHRHTWTSLLRNLGGRADLGDVATSDAPVRDHFGPDDIYAATLVGLLAAIEAGITTVVDRSEPPPADAHADAALRAHADAGLRTVLVAPATRESLARLRETAGPSTTIAFGSQGGDDLDRLAGDWALARELGLRIHAHADASSSPGTVAALHRRGLLGRDVTLVHHLRLDDADLDAIAASGASVSLAPSSEMAEGLGPPPIQGLMDRDVRPGLGIDHVRMAPGDMFAQMRATISMQHATVFDRKLAGKAGLPRLMSTRDAIRYATVDGARAAGLGDVTGSIVAGMQADLVVLRADRPNIFPVNDPIGAVVWGMDTSNVDHVFVGGRALLRDGVLVADLDRARRLATEARDRVVASAGIALGGAA
jgi:5-methylthioadenosine/S-adenosylhomocysteine deaminase